jgi:Flp pilus assembly protein TadG
LGPKDLITRGRKGHDERGAEVVEFAVVAVLLVAMLYGIVSLGIMLGAKVTVTQAASDGARAGIVQSNSSLQISVAEHEAANDLTWMGQPACIFTASTTAALTCLAWELPCAANTAQTCLTVQVTYNYSEHPIFPVFPGTGVIMPKTIVSTNVLQVSTPSS